MPEKLLRQSTLKKRAKQWREWLAPREKQPFVYVAEEQDAPIGFASDWRYDGGDYD